MAKKKEKEKGRWKKICEWVCKWWMRERAVPKKVWLSSIAIFVISIAAIYCLFKLTTLKDLKDINYIILSLTAAVAAPFAIWRMTLTHQQTEINQQTLHTGNYARAVEQLGKENLGTRLGAIYTLKKIAEESPSHHRSVVDLLCAYIRGHRPYVPNQPKPKPKPEPVRLESDVEAALKTISERRPPKGWGDNRLDLKGINLQGIDLIGFDLKEFDLRQTHLEEAYLWGANLERADLRGADLQRADFHKANLKRAILMLTKLQGADLEEADLRGADLRGADLRKVDFKEAQLEGADLLATNLCGADLSEALHLKQKQIDSAFGDGATKLPKDIQKPPFWPAGRLNREEAYEKWQRWLSNKEPLE